MDEKTQSLIDHCFLRPISDPRTTNTITEVAAPKVTLKTELQVLRLSDESQNIIMEILRSIHGKDFQLDDAKKYKDRGARMKNAYWQDSGSLIVQSVTNYPAITNPISEPENRLHRFAIGKLENYGFASSHCQEALKHCDWDVDKALILLFRKYMQIPDKETISESYPKDGIEEIDLISVREDEKSALESIYDKIFEEKDRNSIWNFKFPIDNLLKCNPSAMKNVPENEKPKENTDKQKKNGKAKCRNYAKNGTCKYGSNCRFSHAPTIVVKPEKTVILDENENEKWFYLEIRFPPGTKYPYEAPLIYLKTTCHDIPREILLKLSRRLFNEAKEITADGMPCIYSLAELLQQNDENIAKEIKNDRKPFPNPDKSLFFIPSANDDIEGNLSNKIEQLSTHYELGQTSRCKNNNRNPEQVERENRQLVKRFMDHQADDKYRKIINARQKLPAFGKMMEILELIENHPVVVISGETGCGKSTQVPQFILDNWLYQSSKLAKDVKQSNIEIICTQPRRISAIGVAERVAEERAERIGASVGYQIRLENKISSATRLIFCTTGILLRRLVSDPFLTSVTHIIVDEVHERSEESDFLLLLLKEILNKRKNLKVILMSATLNANLFSDYFGGVPILDIPGRTFPVEQLFLEDILELCDFVMENDSQYCRKINKKNEESTLREMEYSDVQASNVAPPNNIKDENLNLAAIYARYSEYSTKTGKIIHLMEPMKINPELIESVLKYIIDGDHNWPREGSILIFLPGLQEIQVIHEALCDSQTFGPRSGNFLIVPLHSSLSTDEQSLVFQPAPKGKRKIVLSTNIAETSVTIDDCVFVIDTGLMKEKRFDANRNMESLDLVWVSRANAMQRKGRAGRVMPGICIHLFTHHRFQFNILSQPVPEIHRVPLEQTLLRIKTMPNFEKHKVLEVLGNVIEPPTEENIISAIGRLQDVGAFDEEQNLTALGLHLSALPVDVKIAKLMLFGAIFQCLDSVLTIAACLSHKSPFVCPFNKRAEAEKRKREFAICNSDHLTCLQVYKKWLNVSKRSRLASRNFADENFLSLKTLQTISDVKYQLLELLVSIGFVPINVPRKRKFADDNILELTGAELNVNGENNRLLISLLYAGLYPNIVKILSPEKSYIQTVSGAMPKMATARDLRFKTREDGYVAIHPSSTLSEIGTFQSPFLIYQEKVKTSKIFIRECSMVPILPLTLFAGKDLKVELHDGDFLILLEDGWIVLKAKNHQTAEMVNCLRVELVKLLEEKIRDPCLNLLHHENGRKIIHTIVYLITNNG